jgi:hypothetical protein
MRWACVGAATALLAAALAVLTGWLVSDARYARRHAYDPLVYR